MTFSGRRGSLGRRGAGGSEEIPKKIGRYEIRRFIGGGGQGVVYLAYDPNLAIEVAVKVLHPDDRTEEFLERFMLEGRTTVRLTAENVVRVYDLDPQYPYLVMEFCADGDLDSYLRSRKRRPLAEILGITRSVLQALVAAHENEPPILHRDLKPGNVLFKKDVPKVADFGLAKILGGNSGGATTRGWKGTVRYMSPEQLRDPKNVDARTDLWSLGVMLYEMLAWVRPFDQPGDLFVNVAVRIHTEPPRPFPYALPEPLQHFLEKALAKVPDQRFRSAREMTAGLDDVLRAIPDADRILVPPESFVDDVSRKALEVSALLESNDTNVRLQASHIIREMKRLAPDDSLPKFWERRLLALMGETATTSGSGADSRDDWIQKRIASVRSLRDGRHYREALQLLYEILRDDPDNSVALEWVQRIKEEERRFRDDIERSHQDADRARERGDLVRVREIWRAFLERYPKLEEAEAEFKIAERELFLHEQRRARERTGVDAASRLAAADLEGALGCWRTYLAAYPGDPEGEREAARIEARLREKELEAHLAALEASIHAFQESDRLEDAMAACDEYLRERPGSSAILSARAAIVARIEARDTARKFEEACAAAGARLERHDHRGVVRIWEEFLAGHPAHGDAKRRLDEARSALEAHERRVVSEEIAERLAALEGRLESGRYRSAAGIETGVRGAVAAARKAKEGDLPAMHDARSILVETEAEAESAITGEIERWRWLVRERLAEARRQLGDVAARPAAGVAAAGSDRVREAIQQGLGALCEVFPAGQPGDPLSRLQPAARTLEATVSALLGNRDRAVDEARALARDSVEAARRAVGALEKVVGARADEVGVGAMMATVQGLATEIEAPAPDRLGAILQRAEAVRAQADSSRLAEAGRLVRDVQRLLDDAVAVVQVTGETGRIGELARKAVRSTAPTGDEPLPALGELLAIRDEMAREIEKARRTVDETLSTAKERWFRAMNAWKSATAGRVSATIVATGQEIVAHGEESASRGRASDLDRAASRLERLTDRCRLDSVFEEHRELIEAIEEASGENGVSSPNLRVEGREQLSRYRDALARGDLAGIRAIAPLLEKLRPAEGDGARRGPSRAAIAIPELHPSDRRFNERHNPDGLKALDDLEARLRGAESQGQRAEAARLAADLLRAHRRLLHPDPAWRPYVLPAAAVLMVAALAWKFRPTETLHSVFVVSSRGEVEVGKVTPGIPEEGRAKTVDERGTTWTGLKRGSYRVELVDGGSVSFVVPRDGVVVLPAGPADWREAIQHALQESASVGER